MTELVVIDLPPGVYANGTDLQAAGRWRDASLVRWRQNAMMPVGGWRDHWDSVTGATPTGTPRGALAWADNASEKNIAWGSYNGLFAGSAGGTISDITPVGLTVGDETPASKTGYGMGLYGAGRYGAPRSDSGSYTDATTWSLDHWGENLVACSDADQTIYEWDLIAATATAVTNAPTCSAIVVTDERFILALGADGEPGKVAWCDREDNTVWTAAATNEAGEYTLQTSGRLMQGVRTRGQTLLLTDNDAWAASYVNSDFAYGFEQVGSGCGVASRKAAVAGPFGVMWLGDSGFYAYMGGVVEPVPCDVLDLLLSSISTSRISQMFGVLNSTYDEIWWFYPSEGSLECDSYVSYNYLERHWSIGQLARTTGIERGVFDYPIYFDASANLYDHEFQTLSTDGLAYAESGPVMLDAGDRVVTVNELIPDEETQGEVTAKLRTRFYPNGTETEHGPIELTNPTSIRVTGRQFRIVLEGKANKDFRTGIQRVRVSRRGRR